MTAIVEGAPEVLQTGDCSCLPGSGGRLCSETCKAKDSILFTCAYALYMYVSCIFVLAVVCNSDDDCSNRGTCLETGNCGCVFRMIGSQCLVREFVAEHTLNPESEYFHNILLYSMFQPIPLSLLTRGWRMDFVRKTLNSVLHCEKQMKSKIKHQFLRTVVNCNRDPCFNDGVCEAPGVCNCTEDFEGTFCHLPAGTIPDLPPTTVAPVPTPAACKSCTSTQH